MKRMEYQVFINGELKATRYAYNTARRQIRAEIKRISLPGQVWEYQVEMRQIGKWCEQIWKERATGQIIKAEVKSQ